jgi:hypothetical protein
MSKESNSQYLLEVKHEYSRQLCNLLVPVMYEGIHSIYTEATKNKKDTPMKIFQILLSRIPQWNQHIITNEYQRILNKTQCDFIADLITAVFISHAKILSSVKSKKKSKTLNLKVPNGDYFIHKAYIECARYFWKNPYLFCDNISTIEYQRNMREAESVIEQSINETVRKLLPVKNILQQYINLDESSSSDSSSSSSDSSSDADGAIGDKKKKKKKKYASESDTEPDAVITKESIREKQYITNNMTDRDKKHLEKMVKTTLSSTPKDISIVEQNDVEANGCFSMYSIGNDIPAKEVIVKTLDEQKNEEPFIQNDIKTVVISPSNSFMNGVEEITLNNFNMDDEILGANDCDNIDTDYNNMGIDLYETPIDMDVNIMAVDLNQKPSMEFNGDIFFNDNVDNAYNADNTDNVDNNADNINNADITVCMPEPIIDIYAENIKTIEKQDTFLPKPSSIMSDVRSMNSRIDEKLGQPNDNISSKTAVVSSKSVSATIKQQESSQIKNITLTQPPESQTQTRQPNLKKKTEIPINTQTGGNPKYSFF